MTLTHAFGGSNPPTPAWVRKYPASAKTCMNFEKLHTSVINGNSISPRILPTLWRLESSFMGYFECLVYGFYSDVKLSLRTQVQREDVLTQSHLMTQSRRFRNRKLHLTDAAESELGGEVALFTILGNANKKVCT